MFQTSQPVIAEMFYDRESELERLNDLVDRLLLGNPIWLAIVGPRKIGKTSLVLELARRRRPEDGVVFVVLDALSASPLSLEVFRTYALRAVDALLRPGISVSLELAATLPAEYRDALDESVAFRALPRELRALVRELPDRSVDEAFIRACLQLPELVAEQLDRRVVVAIDEFQELASLAAKHRGFDPLPIMRSVWQHHRRTAYVVSGSGRSMLEELVTSRHSPFFQHFSLMNVDSFTIAAAVELLLRGSPRGRRITKPLARSMVEAIGTHPYYLQLVGEALVARDPPYDERTLKDALQDVVFSRSGRLALYFQNEFNRIVGRSSYLAAVLTALAQAPARVTDLAGRIRIHTADASRYIERLGDAVTRDESGVWSIEDPTLALWLRWRAPGGSALPMSLLGDEAEREAARLLARMGFELVYQSLASRGAFDLLATRNALQLGVQVRRRAVLPLRFGKHEWNRMAAEAKRFGWRWVVAALTSAGDLLFLDPSRARKGKEIRLGPEAGIDNLLAWLG
jgi:AAA+ ATPase superfamily predicted ATPase/Holliday junction resolvase